MWEINLDNDCDGIIFKVFVEFSLLKYVWVIFRVEEFDLSGVKIINFFLLFVLFVDKFVVYFLIGFVDDNRMGNKKYILGKKGKKCGGKIGIICKIKFRMKSKVFE